MQGHIFDAFDGEAGDFLPDEAFDRGEFFQFVGCDKGEGVAGALGAAGAADAVHVVFGVLRDVEVYDMADAGDVDAAGGDVGGDHDPVASGFETFEGFDALVLRAVRVEDGDGLIVGAQALGDAVRAVFGAGEDEGAGEIAFLQEGEQHAEFAALVGDIDAVVDGFRDGAGGADFDALGIAERPGGEVGDFRRQGGGEKEGLTVFRAASDDAFHRCEKADIEHAVDFVEDEDFDVIEVDEALLEVVFEASGRGDEHIESGAQSGALGAVADAAKNAADFEVGEAGEVAHGGFDLHGEFAGGLEDKAAEGAVGAEFLQGGQREGRGFSRAGLGGGDDIASGEGGRNRPELDRGGFPVAHGLDAIKEWLGQPKLGERHVKWGQSGLRQDLSNQPRPRV